jgi:FkbM family methyltransferase
MASPSAVGYAGALMSRSVRTLDFVHRLLSRSALLTRLAILLRNQCRAVIKYRLMTTHQIEKSGEEWLLGRLAPHCRTVVDVGANRGTWSAAVLRHAKQLERLVAYEPGRRAAEILRERIGVRRELLLVELALSDHSAAAERFYELPDGGNTSSFSLPAESGAIETAVAVSTLDAEAERLGLLQIDLLKVDAEGHDFAVLRGARRLLAEKRIRFVQWEYSDVWIPAGATLAATLAYMNDFGYRSLLLKGDGLFRFDYDLFGEFFTFSNFVSVREHDLHLVGEVHELL